MFGGCQQPRSTVPEPLSVLTCRLKIPILVMKFEEYMRLNRDSGANGQNAQDMARHQREYFNSIGIPVPQFHRDGIETHHMRWTGDKEFRKTGDGRADWVWIRYEARSIDADGKLDGRMVGKLHGLFRIWDRMHSLREVALVRLLQV